MQRRLIRYKRTAKRHLGLHRSEPAAKTAASLRRVDGGARDNKRVRPGRNALTIVRATVLMLPFLTWLVEGAGFEPA